MFNKLILIDKKKTRTEETSEISRLKDSNKDYEHRLILMEEENATLNKEIDPLKSDQNNLYNQQDQNNRDQSIELQSIINEHEKLKRTHLEQMGNLENQLKISKEEKHKCF